MTEPAKGEGLPDFVFELRDQQRPTVDMDLVARIIREAQSLPPLEPVYLTQKQLEQVRTAAAPTDPYRPPWAPVLLSVPVHIVGRLEDSTPYKLWLEKVKQEYMQAPPLQVRWPAAGLRPGALDGDDG